MHESASAPSAKLRVYIVDDEWLVAQTLAEILCREGYQAHAFHNPGQALVRCIEYPPDVLIADVMMPGMTGIELAIALRRAGHEGRIVLFSGQSGAQELLNDARVCGYDFELLDKPVHPLQLLLRLQHGRPGEAKAHEPAADSPAPPLAPGSRSAA